MPVLRRILVLAGLAAAMGAGVAQTVSVPQQANSAQARRAPSVVGPTALIDINTATAAELTALPGMGREYARRIIEGRPYTAKNQLVGRGVLPQTAYDRIAPQIIARRPKSAAQK